MPVFFRRTYQKVSSLGLLATVNDRENTYLFPIVRRYSPQGNADETFSLAFANMLK
jgi:hypothetical protein